jgi:hypothetical protein
VVTSIWYYNTDDLAGMKHVRPEILIRADKPMRHLYNDTRVGWTLRVDGVVHACWGLQLDKKERFVAWMVTRFDCKGISVARAFKHWLEWLLPELDGGLFCHCVPSFKQSIAFIEFLGFAHVATGREKVSGQPLLEFWRE